MRAGRAKGRRTLYACGRSHALVAARHQLLLCPVGRGEQSTWGPWLVWQQ